MDTKTCTKCGRTFPATAEWFHRDRSRKDGLRRWCKECHCESSRLYREANPEQQRERIRLYHETNPEYRRLYYETHQEQALERSRLYYETHREQALERRRLWREAHREQAHESQRLWREAHREQRRASSHRRRALKRDLPAAYSADHWRAALDYFEGKCAVCGRPAGFFHTLAADHWVPLSSPACPGTVVTNIVPLCHGTDGCNNRKLNKPAHAWLVETFGARKAKRIEARIADFFQHMRQAFGE